MSKYLSKEWHPSSRAEYWDKLEVVPPRHHNRNGFVMGEMFTTDDEGRGIYMIFRERRGIYEWRYGTLAEAREILGPDGFGSL